MLGLTDLAMHKREIFGWKAKVFEGHVSVDVKFSSCHLLLHAYAIRLCLMGADELARSGYATQSVWYDDKQAYDISKGVDFHAFHVQTLRQQKFIRKFSLRQNLGQIKLIFQFLL